MDILGRLQAHPLFATFTPQALAEAARLAAAVTYQPGDVCIRHDEAGETFGILTGGRLEAVRGHGTPDRQRLGYIEPGECFGEMSMLTGNPTAADVVAVEPSEAVVFLQEAISPILAMNPGAIRFITKLLAQRLAAPQPEQPRAGRRQAARYALGAVEPMRLLSVSCRQSDIRYAYYDTTSEKALAHGAVTGLGGAEAEHVYHGPKGKTRGKVSPATHEAAIAAALAALTATQGGVIRAPSDLAAVGHRVLHGGTKFNGPAVIDAETKAEIGRIANLAPLDNPYNLAGIEACQRLFPGVPQIAVLDRKSTRLNSSHTR